MEAVGQLSGGIAHDFNNLLTIIIGNLDTMKRRLAELAESTSRVMLIAKLETPLEAAMKGAKRGAAHAPAARLLAPPGARAGSARSQPAGVGHARHASPHARADISIETVLGAGLWPTFADAHQLENVLLNLALNAKAAMPDGGCLTIETANTYLDDAYARRFGDVKPGQYVVSASPTPAPASPRDPRPGVRAVLHHQAARARARASGSPWCMASSSNRAAMCASTARSAAAPR